MEARLYLVLVPRLCGARGAVATADEAIAGGAGIVQLRDKDADDATFTALARDVAAVCRARGVPFIVNDRVHLFEATGADGVHVGEDDAAPEDLRARWGGAPIIGLSTHDRDEVAAAAARGATYVGLGPMFPTKTKRLARRPSGRAMVERTRGATPLPVFPIGGIDLDNAPELIAGGATRLAVSAALCAAPAPRRAAEAFLSLLSGGMTVI